MAGEPKQGAKRRGGSGAARAGSADADQDHPRAAGTRRGERAARNDAGKDAGKGGFSLRPEDALAFMQKMWNPFGVPLPGFGMPVLAPDAAAAAPAPAAAAPTGPGIAPAQPFGLPMPFPSPAAMFAALDPAEVERRIGEMRVIEGWLRMTLGMMEMSIRTLELQKASLEAMRGGAPRQDARE